MNHKLFISSLWLLVAAGSFTLTTTALADSPTIASAPSTHSRYLLNEGPTLPSPASTIRQNEFPSYPLEYVRLAGMQVFSTAFRKNVICQVGFAPITDGDPPIDGFGDGCGENFSDPTRHHGDAGRPTLQNNGTFLRVNGMGAQTCVECHDEVSSRTVPFTFGIGGHAGLAVTEMIFSTQARMHGENATIDVDDKGRSGDPRGFAEFDGRVANPPDLFGVGGIQLVGEEMTAQLHAERRYARRHPGKKVALIYTSAPPSDARVSFGYITCGTSGSLVPAPVSSCDTSEVHGVNSDLVIRPFGRKGEFSTVRAFDDDAFAFHFGIQPEEVDSGDPDGDGVSNELDRAQMSALEVFLTTQKTPVQTKPDRRARLGAKLFKTIGCASCHIPELDTKTRYLVFRLPPSPTLLQPRAFSQSSRPAYYEVDLSKGLADFPTNKEGGIRVKMFSDLKRHYMGRRLCENAAFNDRAPAIAAEGAITGPDATDFNCMFITAKLWGVFDSAPYMHDGRALILSNAILLHGGEAAKSAKAFRHLGRAEKNAILAFLATLRNPSRPNSDVVPSPEGCPKRTACRQQVP